MDQIVKVGEYAYLDGSGTTVRVPGTALSYLWSFEDWPGKADGAISPVFSDASAVKPSFQVAQDGSYLIRLTVYNDPYPNPGSDYVKVTTQADATQLIVQEYQATSALDQQSTPTLGRDAIGDYVVFTSYAMVGSLALQSDIYYQRLHDDGQPLGARVPVAATSADERLNAAYGDYIVYTQFESITSYWGKTILYQISTGMTTELDSTQWTFSPKIYGDVVVWLYSASNGNMLMMHRLGPTAAPEVNIIAGPTPSAKDSAVGDRFIVWSQAVNAQYDLTAYDLTTGVTSALASDPASDERLPATSGPWVVYQFSAHTAPSIFSIHARNLDTGEKRVVADNGAMNMSPHIDGNLISYESNVSGNWDIYVYRIAQGDTFRATTRPEDQRLNHIHGNLVAYADTRTGNLDVYVASLNFTKPPVAEAGPDQVMSLIGSTVRLDGSESYDPEGNALTYAWTITSKPNGSIATLSDPSLPNPTFVADVHGSYVVSLVVTNFYAGVSTPDTVTVSFENAQPVANAGDNQSVPVGTTVYLSGSGADADNDALTYHWYFSSKPTGSTAQISHPDIQGTSFTADVAGTYVVSLVVNDGFADSAASLVTITVVSNAVPAIGHLTTALDKINLMLPGSFKSRNMMKALTNKINGVIDLLDQGKLQEALTKLENDILAKTDGYAKKGAADKNDWIVTFAAQQQVYPHILDAINALK